MGQALWNRAVPAGVPSQRWICPSLGTRYQRTWARSYKQRRSFAGRPTLDVQQRRNGILVASKAFCTEGACAISASLQMERNLGYRAEVTDIELLTADYTITL